MNRYDNLIVSLCGKCGTIHSQSHRECEVCGTVLGEPIDNKSAKKQSHLIKKKLKKQLKSRHINGVTPEEADRIKSTAIMSRGLPRRF